MLKGESIVCFANDYRSDPTSKQQIMTILSGHNKILWVNSIALRTPRVSISDLKRIWEKVAGFFRGLDKINDNLYVFTPLVLPLPTSRLSRKLNVFLLKIYLRFHIRKLKLTEIQLWTFMPTMVEIVGKLQEKKLIYYCVDEWSEFTFIDRNSIVEMEKRLLHKADLVITTAQKLYEDKKRHNPNTHLIRHGVDFDFFSRALHPSTREPDDICNIPKPRIGFFGLIHEWIDVPLLEQIAAEHPDWSIVLIGKVAVEKTVASLKGMKNVHFLGQKSYSTLAAYCKGFNVGLIPFVVNPLTLNVNPIKLREYLAAGLPVVSTNLPEIAPYGEVVHIADTPSDFINSIKKALTEESAQWVEKRQLSIAAETWLSRVNQISELVEAIK